LEQLFLWFVKHILQLHRNTFRNFKLNQKFFNMKKRHLKSLRLQKSTISNLQKEAVKGQLRSGSGDTHPDYTCHPETCAGGTQI
jgi:hypothetical protein